jgi:hypothetical protein
VSNGALGRGELAANLPHLDEHIAVVRSYRRSVIVDCAARTRSATLDLSKRR